MSTTFTPFEILLMYTLLACSGIIYLMHFACMLWNIRYRFPFFVALTIYFTILGVIFVPVVVRSHITYTEIVYPVICVGIIYLLMLTRTLWKVRDIYPLTTSITYTLMAIGLLLVTAHGAYANDHVTIGPSVSIESNDPDFDKTTCTDIDNKNVRIMLTFELPPEMGAAAVLYKGNPIVFFSMSLLTELPATNHAAVFVLLHECGHQSIGHSKRYSNSTLTPEQLVTIEHEADCYAVKHYVARYGTTMLNKALDDLHKLVSVDRKKAILSCRNR